MGAFEKRLHDRRQKIPKHSLVHWEVCEGILGEELVEFHASLESLLVRPAPAAREVTFYWRKAPISQ